MTGLFEEEIIQNGHRKGMGSHHSAGSDSEIWLTPPEIIEGLGPFDLDPCAAPEPRAWPTAATHYTRVDDGLKREWPCGARVWLNPPYQVGVIGRWLARLADHGCGTALIFARTETDAFHEQVWKRAAGILFLRGRLHFHHSDGRRAKQNAGAPSCLVAYGVDDAWTLLKASQQNPYFAGHFVDLKLWP